MGRSSVFNRPTVLVSFEQRRHNKRESKRQSKGESGRENERENELVSMYISTKPYLHHMYDKYHMYEYYKSIYLSIYII